MTKVLVVATSRKTHGGISSVIKVYRASALWKKFHCMWIETHRNGGMLCKLAYFIWGLIEYVILLPWYDIVHIHVGASSSAIRKLIFLKLAKIAGKKVIVHLHASFQNDKEWVYKYLFDNADKVIVLSAYWKSTLCLTFPNLNRICDKVQILFNPCTVAIEAETFEVKKQFLFAGILTIRKGYKDMIRAFARIAQRYPDWKIVFAGSGEIEGARNLAKDLHIEQQVVFLGWIDGKEKDRAFKESAAVCLPSYTEGFPMAVLEAWAYGKPVIATSVGGLLDIAVDGENALVFEPGDIHTLAEKMEMLICDKDLRRQLADNGLKLSDTIFSPSAISEQLGHIYEELSNNPQKVACK